MNKIIGSLGRMFVAMSLAFIFVGAFGLSIARAGTEDSSVCASCHDAAAATHAKGVHARLDCAKCHSGTEKHLAAPGPDTKPARPDAAACQVCHIKDANRMNWAFSEHKQAGLDCTACHSNHTPKKIKGANTGKYKDANSALCVSCHREVNARFNMPSHHPLKEGGVSCVDCHNPHAGKNQALTLKTEVCTKCHQAVRGPHAMEHPPVVEDCLTCHTPHGSPIRKLLKLAQPALCLRCHSLAANRHAIGAVADGRVTGSVLRNCTACHGGIHGSAFDQHLRY